MLLPRGLVATVVFGIAMASFARIPLLPEIARDLSLSTGDIGLLMGAFGLGRVVADLPAGRVADSGSSRVGFAVAGLALAVSTGALAVSQSFALALAASVVTGSASAVTNTLGMYAFATSSAPERRGAGMAAYATALMAGLTLGPAFGGVLASVLDWRGAMLVAASLGLVISAICLLVRGDGARGASDAPLPDLAPALVEASSRLPLGPPARTTELVVLASVPFVTFMAFGALAQTLVPIIGDERLGFSTSTVGLAIAIAGSTRFFSAWLAGTVSDRISRKVALLPTLLFTALSAAMLAVPGTGAWIGAIMLLGLGSSSISVAAAALSDVVSQATLGPQLAIFRLSGDVGLLVGPVVAAALYGLAGPGPASAVIAVVTLACAVAAALLIPSRR